MAVLFIFNILLIAIVAQVQTKTNTTIVLFRHGETSLDHETKGLENLKKIYPDGPALLTNHGCYQLRQLGRRIRSHYLSNNAQSLNENDIILYSSPHSSNTESALAFRYGLLPNQGAAGDRTEFLEHVRSKENAAKLITQDTNTDLYLSPAITCGNYQLDIANNLIQAQGFKNLLNKYETNIQATWEKVKGGKFSAENVVDMIELIYLIQNINALDSLIKRSKLSNPTSEYFNMDEEIHETNELKQYVEDSTLTLPAWAADCKITQSLYLILNNAFFYALQGNQKLQKNLQGLLLSQLRDIFTDADNTFSGKVIGLGAHSHSICALLHAFHKPCLAQPGYGAHVVIEKTNPDTSSLEPQISIAYAETLESQLLPVGQYSVKTFEEKFKNVFTSVEDANDECKKAGSWSYYWMLTKLLPDYLSSKLSK